MAGPDHSASSELHQPRHNISTDPVHATLSGFAADFGAEFRDTASVAATTTRLVNTYCRSGLSLPHFVKAMYSARQTTRERLSAIKARDPQGQATAVSYWCAVVEERAGLRPPPDRPEHHVAPTIFAPLPAAPLSMQEDDLRRADREAQRVVMLARLREEFGIPDVAAFCKEFGRPPYFGDIERTVRFVRERRRTR